MTPVPDAWCVVLGTPGTTLLTIVGPFATQEEAGAHEAEHASKHPEINVTTDVLVNPANCP